MEEIDEKTLDEKMKQEGFTSPKQILLQERKEAIRKWNEMPVVRNNGIKAIDTNYEKFLWMFLIILLLAISIFTFRTWYPEKFKTTFNSTTLFFVNITNIINPPSQNIINNINISLNIPDNLTIRIVNITP